MNYPTAASTMTIGDLCVLLVEAQRLYRADAYRRDKKEKGR